MKPHSLAVGGGVPASRKPNSPFGVPLDRRCSIE
jgi:hypothetical protein